jgi:hypothetical protein
MIVTAAEVLKSLFEGEDHHVLYLPIAAWVTQDRRFRSFAHQYRGKIRRKLRNTREVEGFADLKFELEVAYWLLQERRFEVEYEKYEARQGGPDYTVAFRVNTLFNVEVRRIRSSAMGDEHIRKLVETITDKARQMQPNAINLLMLSDANPSSDDLAAATTLLRGLAERKVEDYFKQRGYKNSTDFLKQYRQLSGIMLKTESLGILWLNSLAKHPIPRELALALERLP